MRDFDSLTEREVLALAIASEEEDGRIYADFAEGLREHYPATATIFQRMQQEESNHRKRLLELFEQRFGQHIPLVRRQDVRGFVKPRAVWLMRPLGLDHVRRMAGAMEAQTRQFYQRAAERTSDVGLRKLLGDLEEEERKHSELADNLQKSQEGSTERTQEDESARKLFVLQVIQPGLAGLMDGSVSTLAPLFAAAFATKIPFDAFRVGMAASIGAGISMGFAEALSDDGSLTGRGRPYLRGVICGLMTTVGGLGHTLPYLINNFRTATGIAVVVVFAELAAISYIRKRYMDTPLLRAAFQVVVGGVLVLLAGILLGVS